MFGEWLPAWCLCVDVSFSVDSFLLFQLIPSSTTLSPPWSRVTNSIALSPVIIISHLVSLSLSLSLSHSAHSSSGLWLDGDVEEDGEEEEVQLDQRGRAE